MPRSAKLDQLLAGDAQYQPLVAKMREIRLLDGHCHEFLPPELARAVRVSNLRDGRLILLAAHSAAAAKLRMLSPSLCEFLGQQGAKVNSVSVSVQPRRTSDSASQRTPTKPISPAGILALSRLYDALGDSPARRALKSFLDHDRRGRKRRGVASGR